MNRIEEIKVGARVRHMLRDTEGVIVGITGDFVFIQLPDGGKPEPSLIGAWEIIESAPQDQAA